jgi:hypothetical protein
MNNYSGLSPELNRKVCMVTIVFKNTDLSRQKVIRVAGVRMSSDFIYGVLNGREVPIATGTGSLWHVQGEFFNAVEIQSTSLKLLDPDDNRKAA